MGVFWYVVTACVAGLAAYFGAYARKKGENLATKEDFGELLEQVRQQTRATEEVRSRVTWLHSKQAAAIEEIWDKLISAFAHTAQLVASFQQYADLDRMEDERFRLFVQECSFDKADKAELLRHARGDRNRFYQERLTWYRCARAKDASRELYEAIQRKSIFLEPEIRSRLLQISDLMWDALVTREIGHEVNDYKMWAKAAEQVNKKVIPLKDEIESVVQRHLGYENRPRDR